MSERDVPPELSRLDAELGDLPRKVARRVQPGGSAVVIGAGVAMLLFAVTLPWQGASSGFDALVGAAGVGPLPRLFAWTAIAFGVLVSVLALVLRRWGLAWLSAIGCGFSIVDGVLAIWSRQTGVGDAVGEGPGVGLVLAWLAIVLLTAAWARLAWSRPGAGVLDSPPSA